MQPIVSSSPDNRHNAVLEYVGEIRFGPPYYSLRIDKIFFGDRIFGDSCLWSPNSRYFAAQEWETTSEGHGPQTHLLLIDVETNRECILSRAEKGFIVPRKFENDRLIYVKENFAPRTTAEFEIQIVTLDRWQNLNVQGYP
jgi:hypothetical protein